MANQKEARGATPEAKYLEKAKKIAARWSPELRGYIVLATGLFLFLFSLGYFQFLKVAIGILGFIMIAWGTIRSKVIVTATDWFEKIKARF